MPRVEPASGTPSAGGSKRRPGPAPRFSREQLVDEAVAIVDSEGFESLSLRAVARRLGVTPMALYTYVQSSEELVALVVERLVEAKSRELVLPDAWQGALRAFAVGLSELLLEHPAMLRAYADGAVETGEAIRVAESVLSQMRADGLPSDLASEAYLAVHMMVLGLSVVSGPRRAAPSAPVDLGEHTIAAAHMEEVHRMIKAGYLDTLISIVISGVEARLGGAC
jgi:AcrR family transcriptional regulator